MLATLTRTIRIMYGEVITQLLHRLRGVFGLLVSRSTLLFVVVLSTT